MEVGPVCGAFWSVGEHLGVNNETSGGRKLSPVG